MSNFAYREYKEDRHFAIYLFMENLLEDYPRIEYEVDYFSGYEGDFWYVEIYPNRFYERITSKDEIYELAKELNKISYNYYDFAIVMGIQAKYKDEYQEIIELLGIE